MQETIVLNIPLIWNDYSTKMEILKKQSKIFEAFLLKPWKALTFKEIKQLSKNKSDNYVHSTLKKLVKENILKQEKIGNNIVYSADNNACALNTFGYIAEHKAHLFQHIPHKNLQKILNKIKTSFYSLIITGSYAKNKQKQTSDLDIVIICDEQHNPNEILARIKLESELMMPEIHPYVFTQAQFYEMLVNEEENYGKETARNNLIITGAKQYYQTLLEAVKHGFNG